MKMLKIKLFTQIIQKKMIVRKLNNILSETEYFSQRQQYHNKSTNKNNENNKSSLIILNIPNYYREIKHLSKYLYHTMFEFYYCNKTPLIISIPQFLFRSDVYFFYAGYFLIFGADNSNVNSYIKKRVYIKISNILNMTDYNTFENIFDTITKNGDVMVIKRSGLGLSKHLNDRIFWLKL